MNQSSQPDPLAPDSEGSLLFPTTAAPIVRVQRNQMDCVRQLPGIAVLSGAFNPVHEGHRQLAAVAERILGQSVHFELSLTNVDKPVVSASDIRRRITALSDHRVLLTNAPRFIDKAQLFPGGRFVVGFDTAVRILDDRYYDRSVERRDETLRRLVSLDIRFLVAGRLMANSSNTMFATAADLHIPDSVAELFIGVPESQFRMDLSSTEIRSHPAV